MSIGIVDKSVPLRERLRAALPVAIKVRDRNAIAALRSALGAIDNAEAIDTVDVRAGAIENSAVGLGAAEARRRDLTEADIEQIVRVEIADRRTAADEYDSLGRTDRGDSLRAEAATLDALL
ncbi:hypothetical protein [Nocardia sp. NBC_01009]|uniref:hypothetical protein n=1 Tax=Nocardia sp. NBC_01009 TaxID=2975996 RepID=UPI00386CDB3A|nr:GatB/YqeY domain-containing protein [Nocardia sp. NBC_01009]